MAGIISAIIGCMLMTREGQSIAGGLCLMGTSLCLLGINEVARGSKKRNTKKKTKENRTSSSNMISVGKDADEFRQTNYKDVAEQLRVVGFKNIVLSAEKKGVLDTEGDVSRVSIAGNTEFSEYDEFDVDSKVIIHYYSKKYKKVQDIEYK